MYITRDEYIMHMHVPAEELPDNFDQMVELAGDYLNDVTHDYYANHDITHDTWDLRVKRFKRAVIAQVAYMLHSGVTTAEETRASKPSSVTQTIGRTTITKQLSSSTAVASSMTSPVCDDALLALSGTGLLYGGVHYVRR